MNPVRKADDAVLLALACGLSIEQAAKQSGVSVRTIHRRLEETAFRLRLDELRHEMLSRSAAMLTAAGIESVKTLVDLMKPGYGPSTRLGAARSVLELGIKLRSLVEIEDRVQELEQRMKDISQHKEHGR